MSIADVVGLLLRASALATVFALGLRASAGEVAFLLRRPRLLARSLLAMYVVTPLVAVALVLVFEAPLAVEVAVLLMTIAAGAPALPKKLLKLGASEAYVYSLAVITALLAIATVPLSLAVLSAFFDRDVSVPASRVASVIVMGFLAPLGVGMVVGRVSPRLAARIGEPLVTTAGIILTTLLLLNVVSHFGEIAGVGPTAFLLIVTMTLTALAIGHLLGGPDPNDRTCLALASATRFPAIGVLVASLNFPNVRPLPLVSAYALASTLAVIPYVRWRRARQGR